MDERQTAWLGELLGAEKSGGDPELQRLLLKSEWIGLFLTAAGAVIGLGWSFWSFVASDIQCLNVAIRARKSSGQVRESGDCVTGAVKEQEGAIREIGLSIDNIKQAAQQVAVGPRDRPRASGE